MAQSTSIRGQKVQGIGQRIRAAVWSNWRFLANILLIWLFILLVTYGALWLGRCSSCTSWLPVDIRASVAWKDVALFVTAGAIPAAIALANYLRQIELNKASLLRELTTKFFTDASLYEPYYNLVYNYEAPVFRRVVEAIETEFKKADGAASDPFFNGAERYQRDANGELPPGKRRFHPLFFKGSLEETRLDTLLSYLDLIAYHIKRGHLSTDDVKGGLGEVLAVVANKPFITEYLLYISGEVERADERTDTAGVHKGEERSEPASTDANVVRALYDNQLYGTLEELLALYRRKTSTESFERPAIKEAMRQRDSTRNLFMFKD